MPDSVNLDKSVEVWEPAKGHVLRNPALALQKLETLASQNLCGSTAFIDPGSYDFHSYLIAKRIAILERRPLLSLRILAS
jgi:hypothetical protein